MSSENRSLTRPVEWTHPDAVEFYAQHRNQVDDLYPSERVFLPRVLFPNAKVLDVGCACGGFFNIMRTLQPDIRYTGIDTSSQSVPIAQRRYPEASFCVGNARSLPFPNDIFDVVHCTGVAVHVPEYNDVILEAYRVSRRYVIMDMRLHAGAVPNPNKEESYQRLEFDGRDTGGRAHYIIADPDEVVSFVLSLRPRIHRLSATGYFHPVSPTAHAEYSEVCMTVFLMEKGNAATNDTVLDLKSLPVRVSVDAKTNPV